LLRREDGDPGLDLSRQLAGAPITFDATNWDVPQTIGVAATDDSIDEDDLDAGTISLDIENSAAGCATDSVVIVDGVVGSDVTVTINDNDTAALVTSGALELVERGDPDSFTIALSGPPTGPVEVGVTAAGLCRTEPATFHFDATNWNNGQEIEVTPGDDNIVHAQECSIRFLSTSDDARYDGLNHRGGGTGRRERRRRHLCHSSRSRGAESSDDPVEAYAVVLDTRPTSDVVVAPWSADGQLVTSERLRFTPSTWDVP
jgi:hypothetical protein